MNRNASFYIKRGSLIVFIIIIASYSLFQTRNLILGPSIDLISPIDGLTYNQPLLEVKGVAQNIKSLTLEDTPIFTDTAGNFDEKLLLAPGYNILKIDAVDKFGKKTEKLIRVILKENTTTITPKQNPFATSTKIITASTTPATSTTIH